MGLGHFVSMILLAVIGGSGMVEPMDIEALQPIYRQLDELVGSKNMVKIFEYYRGVQVILPLHLYNREAAKQQIVKRYDGTNQSELTRLYGYSERWTRAILRNMEH